MTVDREILKGLVGVYGMSGRVIYAYSNSRGSTRYLALEPEQTAPPVYRGFADHMLVGKVNLKTGEVGQETQHRPRTRQLGLQGVISIAKAAVVALLFLATMAIRLILLLTGSRR
jgi:hypothetical protein